MSWSGFSGWSPFMVRALEGSDVLFDKSGCSLVMMISSFFGKVDMVAVLGVVDLEDV